MIGLQQVGRVIAYNAARRVVLPHGQHAVVIPPHAAEIMEMYVEEPADWLQNRHPCKEKPPKPMRDPGAFTRGKIRDRDERGRIVSRKRDE